MAQRNVTQPPRRRRGKVGTARLGTHATTPSGPTTSPSELLAAIEALRGQARLDSIVTHFRARANSGLKRGDYYRLLLSMPAAKHALTWRSDPSRWSRSDASLATEDLATIWCEEVGMRGSGENATAIVEMFGEASDGRAIRMRLEIGDWGTIVGARGPVRVVNRTSGATRTADSMSCSTGGFPVPPLLLVPEAPPPVPAGFVKCGTCGEYNDTNAMPRVRCRCRGPLCSRCGKNHVNGSGTNSYDERTGRIEHWFYLAGLIPCRECRTKDQEKAARSGRDGHIA